VYRIQTDSIQDTDRQYTGYRQRVYRIQTDSIQDTDRQYTGYRQTVYRIRHIRESTHVRVKVKVALEQATKAQRGSISIVLLFL
jgi:hypothetical protein